MSKKFNYRRQFVVVLGVLLSASVLSAFSCSKWERHTYQSFAVAKSDIDSAVAAYNSGTIPKTPTNRDLIEKARKLDGDAVVAFANYEGLRVAYMKETDPSKQKTAAEQLQKQQLAVTQAVAAFTALAVDVRTLIGKK
jgi:hypothetical protein